MTFAVLFPGQGSQFLGMGADLFEARPDLLGDAADEVLGFSLREVCLEGPEERLTRTEHAQPALFALSYALWEELASKVPLPAAAAGHSLGEYTALAAAGAPYGMPSRCRREGGPWRRADANPSSMAAVIGADLERSNPPAPPAARGREPVVANINAPGQVVSRRPDVAWLEEKPPSSACAG